MYETEMKTQGSPWWTPYLASSIPLYIKGSFPVFPPVVKGLLPAPEVMYYFDLFYFIFVSKILGLPY